MFPPFPRLLRHLLGGLQGRDRKHFGRFSPALKAAEETVDGHRGVIWWSFHKENTRGGEVKCHVFFFGGGDYHCTDFFHLKNIGVFFLKEIEKFIHLKISEKNKNFRFNDWYCWWFRNPANQWILRISHFHRVSYITGAAGLLPWTVVICIDLCLTVLFDRAMRGLIGTTKFWGFELGDLVATRVFFDNTSKSMIRKS